jgi:hypothetical protein
VLLAGRRLLVIDDRFVDRRVEGLALAAHTLDAEPPQRVEEAFLGEGHAFGPRMSA